MSKRKNSVPCKNNPNIAVSWNLGETSNGIQNDEYFEIQNESGKTDDDSNAIASKILFSKKAKRNRKKKKIVNPQLQKYLSDCEFYIIINLDTLMIKEPLYQLGQFIVTPLKDLLVDITTIPILYLYISTEISNCFLYWEQIKDKDEKEVFYCPVECRVPFDALKGLQVRKDFIVVLKENMISIEKLIFEVYLNQDIFCKLNSCFESYHSTPKKNVQSVMKLFYGITIQQYSDPVIIDKHDIERLYSDLSKMQVKYKKANENVQHPSLIPTLRSYQANAVRWMLRQEKDYQIIDNIHPLYIKIHTKDGKILYYNRFGGFFICEEPKITYQTFGGILADEMGLGKTVEVLACLLCNPKSISNYVNGINIVSEKETVNGRIDSKSEVKNEFLYTAFSYNSSTFSDSDYEEMIDSNTSYKLPLRKNKQQKKQKKKTTKNVKYKNINSLNWFAQQQNLECLCGKVSSEFDYKKKIQCENCRTWQHLDCIKKKYNCDDDHFNKHYCPHCWVSQSMGLVSSRATLIVTPACISYQWEEEIEKHIEPNSLKVLVYCGVHTQFFPPPVLADYDIVLTTYNVLRRELNYVDLPHANDDSGWKFRNPKRFMTIPSPLLSIQWWRICLDEAQMVESATTKTAEMAQRLSAVHRWCVTGTPIQKSVDDLYGLLLFLGIDPYSVKLWWKEILFNPYCHGHFESLYEILNSYFWRTVKKDILNQIGIPKQDEQVHWLSFSPVEEHFYFRQHQECSQEAMRKISKFPKYIYISITC